jgi:hypothetical protein
MRPVHRDCDHCRLFNSRLMLWERSQQRRDGRRSKHEEVETVQYDKAQSMPNLEKGNFDGSSAFRSKTIMNSVMRGGLCVQCVFMKHQCRKRPRAALSSHCAGGGCSFCSSDSPSRTVISAHQCRQPNRKPWPWQTLKSLNCYN